VSRPGNVSSILSSQSLLPVHVDGGKQNVQTHAKQRMTFYLAIHLVARSPILTVGHPDKALSKTKKKRVPLHIRASICLYNSTLLVLALERVCDRLAVPLNVGCPNSALNSNEQRI
jgi:hypothetical protein